MSFCPFEVVALVATANRPDFLSTRSLPSIMAQTLRPDRVVIVDDSRPSVRGATRDAIAETGAGAGVDLLENRRSPGASGAWNTGIDHLLRTTSDPHNVVIAILDDDDEWPPEYLEKAASVMMAEQADMVTSTLVRIEDGQAQRVTIPPQVLRQGDFLTGNPGIQGSNLILRMSTLLEAGMFDENLPSCTDRDLCLRISALPDVKYCVQPDVCVKHYASSTRPRLSLAGSSAKMQGLTRFYRKYSPVMSDEQQGAFCERAWNYFDWKPEVDSVVDLGQPSEAGMGEAEPGHEVALVVGVIADFERITQVANLLRGLRELSTCESALVGLEVVLLENSSEDVASAQLAGLVATERKRGLQVYCVDREALKEEHAAGVVEAPECPEGQKMGIARARTVLQSYLYALLVQRPGAVGWILDDDMRLEALVQKRGNAQRWRPSYVKLLAKVKAEGKVDIGIGPYTGAPPLPFAACIRGQMVDLVHSLYRLGNLEPGQCVPAEILMQNRLHTKERRDYYYDLSRSETDRLETPFNPEPVAYGETAGQVFRRIANGFERILAGEQLFRPLVFNGDEETGGIIDGSPLQRGGNTFIFNPESLADTPNPCLEARGRLLRRSDMLWSLAQQYLHRRRVKTMALPVYHDRSSLPLAGLDSLKVVDDIRGYAFYSALHDFLREGENGNGVEGAWVPVQQREVFKAKVGKYVEERLAAFSLSFWRVRGCARSALHYLLNPSPQEFCWIHGEAFASDRKRLSDMLQNILDMYVPHALEDIARDVRVLDASRIETLLDSLPLQCREHRRRLEDVTLLKERLSSQRAVIAEAQVRRVVGSEGDLRFLGMGSEGVVFTDSERVYKVFDYFKSRNARSHLAFLASKMRVCENAQGLYQLLDVVENGSSAILTYPYEDSTPYIGGNGPGLVRLLVECHQLGIVCRNIHPKNLRSVGDKVRLVDYGGDILPLRSESEFEMMCRRAWLSWRFAHRDDLAEVMRATLTDSELPELAGFDYFFQGVRDSINPHVSYKRKIADLIVREKPRRVFDYGCGKGDVLGRLGTEGIAGIGFDPDVSLEDVWQKRWSELDDTTRFLSDRNSLEDQDPFDVVVCLRVLCAIDDVEYFQAIDDLRRLVRTGGKVVVSVCDPEFIAIRHTPEATKIVDESFASDTQTRRWRKRLSSGNERTEYLRSRRRLLRDLASVGLALVDEFEIPTIDLDRFEPVSEMRVFVLKALPPLADVTLMIKCCAMEAATIEVQVQHLVRQLESPRAFSERLLVVDERDSGFLRQYAPGNKVMLKEACQRLLDAGWVDKIVHGPSNTKDIVELNKRWFGLDAEATHATSGPQIASTLAGFEACSSPYCLQLDSDIMIGRLDLGHDYLADMVGVFEERPTATTVAFNICNGEDRSYTSSQAGKTWRVEVRAALMHIGRFKALAPFPNSAAREGLAHTWYRSADMRIAAEGGRSWRGGDKRTFFVHPQNERKTDVDTWLAYMDRVEKGSVPAIQKGEVDLQGDLTDWIGLKRKEPFIFIVGGRDVPRGRFRRCLDSIFAQKRQDWGMVVIDDASAPDLAEAIQRDCSSHADKITVLNVRRRRGLLANMVWAIKLVCANPQSVIVTVDADDMLLSDDVLDRLENAYRQGADLSVGSMLRTDKHAFYPICFDDPRGNRGGNVWQHLRSFRKYLFDVIPDSMFRLHGQYIDLATDWAYMLPLVELAEKPVHLKQALYLYEPSGTGKGKDVSRRESNIAGIVGKKRLQRNAILEGGSYE